MHTKSKEFRRAPKAAVYDERLKLAHHLILLYLDGVAGNSGTANVKAQTIADNLGFKDPDHVRRRIAELERFGYLQRIQSRWHGDRGKQKANKYLLLYPTEVPEADFDRRNRAPSSRQGDLESAPLSQQGTSPPSAPLSQQGSAPLSQQGSAPLSQQGEYRDCLQKKLSPPETVRPAHAPAGASEPAEAVGGRSSVGLAGRPDQPDQQASQPTPAAKPKDQTGVARAREAAGAAETPAPSGKGSSWPGIEQASTEDRTVFAEFVQLAALQATEPSEANNEAHVESEAEAWQLIEQALAGRGSPRRLAKRLTGMMDGNMPARRIVYEIDRAGGGAVLKAKRAVQLTKYTEQCYLRAIGRLRQMLLGSDADIERFLADMRRVQQVVEDPSRFVLNMAYRLMEVAEPAALAGAFEWAGRAYRERGGDDGDVPLAWAAERARRRAPAGSRWPTPDEVAAYDDWMMRKVYSDLYRERNSVVSTRPPMGGLNDPTIRHDGSGVVGTGRG